MVRRGYKFEGKKGIYHKITWDLLPAERPGIRWMEWFRQSKEQSGGKMSTKTFSKIVHGLPTIVQGEFYRRDP